MRRTLVCYLAAVAACAGAVVGCRTAQRQQADVGKFDASRPPAAIDLYVAGVRQYQGGNEDQAVRTLLEATQQNPNLAMAHALLGDLYKARGRYEDAGVHYEAIARLDPYTSINFYNLGVTYHLLDRLQEAAANYNKAIQLDPGDARSTMNLGIVYATLGDFDQAVTVAKRATELDPKSPAAWANFGVALDAKGDHPAAESAYRRSLDLNPEHRPTMLNLGANLVRQQKGVEAVDVLRTALAKGDDAFARKTYGDALALTGKLDEAAAAYTAALKTNPRYASAMNELGQVLIAQYRKGLELDEEKRKAALDVWRKSLTIEPNQPKIQAAVKQWDRQGV
ncbi:MAG TPA: tetratricopeptide repeat protein [Tepidisphaeraceae bacterium]|nr:tetratricopeptide repeat protein [Tepidisphaeraceae bacterium]